MKAQGENVTSIGRPTEFLSDKASHAGHQLDPMVASQGLEFPINISVNLGAGRSIF